VNFVLVLEFLLNFTKEISNRIAVYFLVRFGGMSNFFIGNIDFSHVAHLNCLVVVLMASLLPFLSSHSLLEFSGWDARHLKRE